MTLLDILAITPFVLLLLIFFAYLIYVILMVIKSLVSKSYLDDSLMQGAFALLIFLLVWGFWGSYHLSTKNDKLTAPPPVSEHIEN